MLNAFLAQGPACEHPEQEMLRAEQEQHGEGAVWALLIVTSRHQPSSARHRSSSAAANGPLKVSYLSEKSSVTSCGRERHSLTIPV